MKKYPLWNVNELGRATDGACDSVRGQKAASRGKACDGLSGYVFVGWYGGAGNTKLSDWGPLRGRTVYFWPDADNPGRKAIKAMRELASEYDIKLEVIHAPVGVPKGWDLADAISEGMDIDKILHPVEAKAEPQHFLDDFWCLYHLRSSAHRETTSFSIRMDRTGSADIVHQAFNKECIDDARRSLCVVPYYGKEDGGISWDAAINDIIRRKREMPLF